MREMKEKYKNNFVAFVDILKEDKAAKNSEVLVNVEDFKGVETRK